MTIGQFRRFACLLCTAWVTLLLAEVPGLHACAVHSPVSLTSSHGGVAHNHTHDAGTDAHHKGQCSCISHACCAAAVTTANRQAVIWFDIQVTVHKPVTQKATAVVPAAPDFTIPFSNGPPASPVAPVIAAA